MATLFAKVSGMKRIKRHEKSCVGHPISSDNGLHISDTVTDIRILLHSACGHGCVLFMIEIWSFYHNLILC